MHSSMLEHSTHIDANASLTPNVLTTLKLRFNFWQASKLNKYIISVLGIHTQCLSLRCARSLVFVGPVQHEPLRNKWECPLPKMRLFIYLVNKGEGGEQNLFFVLFFETAFVPASVFHFSCDFALVLHFQYCFFYIIVFPRF